MCRQCLHRIQPQTVCRTIAPDDPCGRNSGVTGRQLCTNDDTGDGQNPSIRRPGNTKMRQHVPVLRRKCRALSRRCHAQLRALSTSGSGAGDHALELPFVAGISVCHPQPDGPQCRSAESMHQIFRSVRSPLRRFFIGPASSTVSFKPC